MNRRNFLRTAIGTSLVLGPAGRLFAASAAAPWLDRIGLQVYTLRDLLGKDAEGTMKAVAAAGYQQVELYGFPNADPLVAAAKDAGLAISSSHFDSGCAVDPKDEGFSDFMKIVEKARETGLTHLVVPYLSGELRKTADDWKKTAGNLNKAAEKAKDAGIRLSYHNHNFEFAPIDGGTTGYDIFIKEFSPDMWFEIDLFWVKVAGLDPVALIKKLNGRISQLHLKDLKDGVKTPEFGGIPGDSFKEVGNGVIDWKSVLAAAKEAGVENCHVEQDQSPDPLSSVKESIAYLRKL